MNVSEDDFVELVFNRYIKSSSLVGDLDDAKRILLNFKKIGVDEIACLMDFGISDDKFAPILTNLHFGRKPPGRDMP